MPFRKQFIIMVGVFLAFSLAFLNIFHHTPIDAVALRVEQSIVRVEEGGDAALMGKRVCTGFVVAPNVIQTAAHCLGESMTVDGVAADVDKVNPELDLATLSVATDKHPLHFSLETPHRFDQVIGMGYGFGFTRPMVLLRTVVFPAYAPVPAPTGLMTTGGWISGMSGGPVVNLKGEVLGIIQRTNGEIGYGVPSVTILHFLLGDQ